MPDESKFFLSELVKIPLRLIEDDDRAGFEDGPDTYADDPLIIIFEDHRFRSFCGGRYLAHLRKERKNAHQAFVFIRNEEYSYYFNNFGKQFQRGR